MTDTDETRSYTAIVQDNKELREEVAGLTLKLATQRQITSDLQKAYNRLEQTAMEQVQLSVGNSAVYQTNGETEQLLTAERARVLLWVAERPERDCDYSALEITNGISNWLVANNYCKVNKHGYVEITDTGRAALEAHRAQSETEQSK